MSIESFQGSWIAFEVFLKFSLCVLQLNSSGEFGLKSLRQLWDRKAMVKFLCVLACGYTESHAYDSETASRVAATWSPVSDIAPWPIKMTAQAILWRLVSAIFEVESVIFGPNWRDGYRIDAVFRRETVTIDSSNPSGPYSILLLESMISTNKMIVKSRGKL
jgi:hypothetical protein